MTSDAHNMSVFAYGVTNYVERVIKKELIKILCDVADYMVKTIDGDYTPWSIHDDGHLPYGGNNQFPVWVGQMHDATGVAIYDEGSVIRYLPTKKALDSQSQRYESIYGIIGNTYLQQAINEGQLNFPKDIWLVLFCAVPYAYKVNEFGSPWGRGVGFFEANKEQLLVELFSKLKLVE